MQRHLLKYNNEYTSYTNIMSKYRQFLKLLIPNKTQQQKKTTTTIPKVKVKINKSRAKFMLKQINKFPRPQTFLSIGFSIQEKKRLHSLHPHIS